MYKFCATLLTLGLSSISLLANTELTEVSYPVVNQDEILNCSPACNFPSIYSDCPPPSYFPCRPCCRHFYVGLDGGWAIGLGDADRISGVGAGVNGFAYNAHAHSGYHVGANLGYRWNCLLRTDLSYTYLKPNSYHWRLDAPGAEQNIRFKAHLHSHLVLLNTYLHLNALYCFLPCLDPYITGGVGVATNRLDDISETLNSGAFVGRIQSFTKTNFGARVGIGAMKYFCRSWIVDFGFNANYIGRVDSNNIRNNANGGVSTLGAYRFENNWIGTFYLGLKYAF